MALKPSIRDLAWMAGGAIVFLLVSLIVLRFHHEPDPAQALASRVRKLGLVDAMRVELASAAEAGRSAVLASTDEESQSLADQSRAHSTSVDRARQELAGSFQDAGTESERDRLEQFSKAFADSRRIDDELLGLAVKNTNFKALGLAFGPAAAALTDMTEALSRLAAARGASPGSASATQLAYGAEIAALRIQALLAPHIVEESDPKMDQIEARMAELSGEVERDLAGLRALPDAAADADLPAAASSWSRFRELQAQILSLSRENTDVRSLTISLDRSRKVMVACQEALGALREAVEAEPIPGVTYGTPVKAR